MMLTNVIITSAHVAGAASPTIAILAGNADTQSAGVVEYVLTTSQRGSMGRIIRSVRQLRELGGPTYMVLAANLKVLSTGRVWQSVPLPVFLRSSRVLLWEMSAFLVTAALWRVFCFGALI
jgi:hypothetical protein